MPESFASAHTTLIETPVRVGAPLVVGQAKHMELTSLSAVLAWIGSSDGAQVDLQARDAAIIRVTVSQ
jgi:hypothetical protein